MKKIVKLILITSLITVIFAGCSNKVQNSSGKDDKSQTVNALEKVKKDGVLTMGLDDSYPPMEFRNDKNELVGFDIDLGQEIGKKLGVKIEVVTTDFSGIVPALKANKFNMILSTLSITDKRKEEIDFSAPYIDAGQIVAVKEGNTEVKNIEDLKGKTVACQLGSTGEQAALKIDGVKEVKKYDKVTEAFHDVSIGRVDAVVVDGQVGGYYMKKQGGGFTILSGKLTEEPVGIGFKKEDKELKEAVQKALDELKKEGTLSKLSEKWFGYDMYKES